MSRQKSKKPNGQLRQSQIVTTFGPGSMLDLPNQSVLVAGLEHWAGMGDEVVEPRLAEKICEALDVPAIKLYRPPADQQDLNAPPTGIGAWQFPEWFVAQPPEKDSDANPRSRMLVHRKSLTKGKFIDQDNKKRSVVPIRFVRACRKGHVTDINWFDFVHQGKSDCKRQLWIEERGTSGDLSEIWIRCDCSAQRSMFDASEMRFQALGLCEGRKLWLGPTEREVCGEPYRLLIRNASHAYFPESLSVISLPDRDEKIKAAVDTVWDMIEVVQDVTELQYERRKQKVKVALTDFSDVEIMNEIQSRRNDFLKESKSVKQAELETLIAAKEEIGNDILDGTFFARSLPESIWKKPWMEKVQRIVLVHRLREVVAQVGFSRFEPTTPDINGDLSMVTSRALIARELSWLPCLENRGEGIFIQFKKIDVEEWLKKKSVQKRGKELEEGFNCWKNEHYHSKKVYPGSAFILFHSFAHLLITTLSLECGYPASSIRERVYTIPSVGYGILLYTSTTDAEGTLGGLVETGRQIDVHFRKALELGELCSNDPVCSEHHPDNKHEHRFLHGAACHGCLLIAETSCEQRNDYLDRSLVVPTLENRSAEFFTVR
ncbi:MAG: DUF1998 domain-containing protein [Planctomycetia bacterium]|nr:DUF1998 domain-containing protein [Planctomycetia bacterium]